MGEFYNEYRAIPGDTFFSISERDEEEGYVRYRPEHFGTKKTIEECVELLRAIGLGEGDSSHNFFKVLKVEDASRWYSYKDGTQPNSVIEISLGPEAIEETEDEWYEHALFMPIVRGLQGYDEDYDDYAKVLDAYHEEQREYFKPYYNALYAAIEGTTQKSLNRDRTEITFTKDKHYFTIRWQIASPDADSMDFYVKCSRKPPTPAALWTAEDHKKSHTEHYKGISFDTLTKNINNLVQGFITGIAIEAGELTYKEHKADQQTKARTPARPVKRKKNKKQRRKK